MSYPYRDDETQAALNNVQNTPYGQDDMPYLNTKRYSLSGYEPRHIEQKELIDKQGVQDNLWWYNSTRV